MKLNVQAVPDFTESEQFLSGLYCMTPNLLYLCEK